MACPGLRVMSFPSKVTVPPFDGDRAGLAAQQARDRVQRGGLAGAVRADERDDLALVYLEGNVTQRMNQAVVNVDVLDFEHCHKLVSSSLIRPDKP